MSALRTQLTWSHFRELIAIDDPLKREFYAEMCRLERWSTRTLQDQIKRLEDSGIRVAEYLSELPPQEMLQRKLHDMICVARERLARQAETTDALRQIEPSAEARHQRNERSKK